MAGGKKNVEYDENKSGQGNEKSPAKELRASLNRALLGSRVFSKMDFSLFVF